MKKIIIITGASGVGKTTVNHYLQKKYNIAPIITHTTRPRRPGEFNGVDYYFETPAIFKQHLYLEQVQYAHYLYGSSVEGLQQAWRQHDWVSIVLDTAGATTYLQKYPQETVIIFLTVAPDELYQRLQQRTLDPLILQQRITSAEFQRDLHLPLALTGRATVITNNNWLATQKQLDQLITHLSES